MLIMALTHMVQGMSFTARLFRHLRTIRDTRKVPEFRTSKLDSNKHQQDHFMYAPRQGKPDKMGDGVHIRPVYGLMQSCKYVEQGTIPGMPLGQWSVTAPCYYYFSIIIIIIIVIIIIIIIEIIVFIIIIILYCIDQDLARLPLCSTSNP